MKTKKNNQSMYQKNVIKENLLVYYKKETKKRDTMLLSKILILSCMIIFVAIVSKFLVLKIFKTSYERRL